jgi:tryptophan synthase alpha chain
MNRIEQLFKKKSKNILNIYYSAGFPKLQDTLPIARALQKAGADIIEIGIPFSDPLADGPIIQNSSEVALKNGMNLSLLLEQLKTMRAKITIPVLLMGYLNPILQMGMEKFLKICSDVGVDGLILPDLPIAEYQREYQKMFEKYRLSAVFLITPATSKERQQQIDEVGSGFLYVVSSASTTGTEKKLWSKQEDYFQRIKDAKTKNPTLIGFNIKDSESFARANRYANGAIVGSAFIRTLQENQDQDFHQLTAEFIKKIRG